MNRMLSHFSNKKNLIILFVGMLIYTCFSCSKNDNIENKNIPLSKVSLIPLPLTLQYGDNNLQLTKEITTSRKIEGIPYELLKSTLVQVLGITDVSNVTNEEAFIRVTQDNTLSEEGYRINIDDNINISYKTSAGLLWGIQTLRQILLQNKTIQNSSVSIPRLTISDAPQKVWRAFHIDLARHMFSLSFLKKVIDMLSFYKINKLQLHLTDDQGWRIEIKKYPALAAQGGWREFDEYDKRCIELSGTNTDYTVDSRFIRNNSEYGGYYTQEEMKDFITYSTKRGIDVIPEIDMPGHFLAAIRVFPELSCTGQAGWGNEFSYPLCAGKTEIYVLLKNIINEVIALFPSQYFHIGADEVETDNWKKCEHCQKLIKEKNLKNVDGLKNYFVGQMADYVRSKGKTVMAWDDAYVSSAPQDLLYTYWRDWLPNEAGEITQKGYPLVFMEWGHFYLSGTPSDEQLKSLYQFTLEPQFQGIINNKLLGYQACVWTEMIPNEKKIGQHIFPSLQAFSELTWGSERNWSNFTGRLPWHLTWLTQNGIHSQTPGFIK